MFISRSNMCQFHTKDTIDIGLGQEVRVLCRSYIIVDNLFAHRP